MIRIRDIRININRDEEYLLDKIADVLMLRRIFRNTDKINFSYEILKKSIDSRKKPDIFFVYTVKVLLSKEDEEIIRRYFLGGKGRKVPDSIIWDDIIEYSFPGCGNEALSKPPVIIGSGPAGLFCALGLAKRGFKPIIIERGQCVDDRSRSVNDFFEKGILNPESNIQFGEGGAGTFSDGKLNTLTKDDFGRNTFVLKTFHEFGAPKDITVDAKPHIGTDVLINVVRNFRNSLIGMGATVLFDSKVIGINTVKKGEDTYVCGVKVSERSGRIFEIETDIVVAAIGHSSRDTFEMLYDLNVLMQQKPFAVGFRMVHPQSFVNKWAYGVDNPENYGLPSADYKVAATLENGRRVYSFCMCPGGYVVNASSEEGRCCVNGMSYNKRDGKYANSAIIAAIGPDDFVQDIVDKDHPLAGMYYQRQIEEKAFDRCNNAIPGQRFSDFEENRASSSLDDTDLYVKGKVIPSNLRGIYTDSIDKSVIESVHNFGKTREGFDDKDSVFIGTETRTSSPVRILRNENLESSLLGLYPCGEGAGYAGGITSAAADGIKVCEKIIEKYRLVEA